MKQTKRQKQNVKKWLTGLRSGEYKRHEGSLKNVKILKSGKEKVSFCCLGVLADVCDVPFAHVVDVDGDCELSNSGNKGNLPPDMFESLTGIVDIVSDTETQDDLAAKNDSGNYSFNKIADYIERKILSQK
jgi:hypothetical protein